MAGHSIIPVLVPFNRPSDARLLLPAGATMERVRETQTSLPCVRKPGYNKVEFPGDFDHVWYFLSGLRPYRCQECVQRFFERQTD